ncbi:MAG: 16S rRNA (cytidine(1402)-2'-O)-methyltransferase [Polyangiales bacterium]
MSEEPEDDARSDDDDTGLAPAVVTPRDRQRTLSIVSTPIGNLEDITLRALRILREAQLVLAEDTRRTRVLCLHHGVHPQLRAFHAHSPPHVLEQVLAELDEGKHVALVTDAGTPLLSDPGAALVAAASARGVRVETIPGPSAITAALTVCGLPVDHFRFLGFLPRSGRRRRELLAEVERDQAASVLFESPRRLADTLDELAELLGPERRVAVCRELTKMHEEVCRGSAHELAAQFRDGARGEITLVIAGRSEALADEAISESALDDRIRALRERGVSTRDAAQQLARETGLRKQAIYARIEAQKTAEAHDSPKGNDVE